MSRSQASELLIVVGAGGVGKTTIAAALGLRTARQGRDSLVMTFDPSLRLKDALGVGDSARDGEQPVEGVEPGHLYASLLDARSTFDRLITRHAPDAAARDRILDNRFYDRLSGGLAGILEYMAVERLFEVEQSGRFEQVVLDTPPTRQALDFLEAPDRILDFLASGALRLATFPWFDERGRLKPTKGWGGLGKGVERYLDGVVGIGLLREISEFFRAFGPLFDGFQERAREVKALLSSSRTRFVLVSGPGEGAVADTLFFARKLQEASFRLAGVVVNRVHPILEGEPEGEGEKLVHWLGQRDRAGVEQLRNLLGSGRTLVSVPLAGQEPSELQGLDSIGAILAEGGL